MTTVRGHHEGSIYQLRSRGVWVAAVSLPDGRRRRRQAASKAEALVELRALQRAVTAEAIDASRLRLGEYLQRWVNDDRHNWAPATRRKHRTIVAVHLSPAAGHIRLSDLSVDDVESLLATRPGLDGQTRRHIRATLRRALTDAQRGGLVGVNVAGLSRPPRLSARERNVLTAGQARQLLETTRGTRYGPLWALLVTTGLRISEALGLTWADVSSDAITVNRALQRIDGEWRRVPTKTTKSRRTIPLTTLARDALREQRAQQAADAGALLMDALVFTTERGQPIHATNLLPKLYADLAAAGLPRVTLHDLRHSTATILLEAGVPLPVVSRTLGHSTVRITMDLYVGRIPELQRDAADKMQEALG